MTIANRQQGPLTAAWASATNNTHPQEQSFGGAVNPQSGDLVVAVTRAGTGVAAPGCVLSDGTNTQTMTLDKAYDDNVNTALWVYSCVNDGLHSYTKVSFAYGVANPGAGSTIATSAFTSTRGWATRSTAGDGTHTWATNTATGNIAGAGSPTTGGDLLEIFWFGTSGGIIGSSPTWTDNNSGSIVDMGLGSARGGGGHKIKTGTETASASASYTTTRAGNGFVVTYQEAAVAGAYRGFALMM